MHGKSLAGVPGPSPPHLMHRLNPDLLLTPTPLLLTPLTLKIHMFLFFFLPPVVITLNIVPMMEVQNFGRTPGNVNEPCKKKKPAASLPPPSRPSTLLQTATPPPPLALLSSALGLGSPRSRRGTWEINWAGWPAQQVPRLPSTHPGPICQPASCSSEPRQQGTTSPARLHYACQMG